ncbi:MAG: cation:proton antiporter [Nanoarchaeota archaeon]|nr:cation:proton antiporter [Nanoarchaeota archaeon]
MVSLDPNLVNFEIVFFIALVMAILLRFLKQPSVIAYILAGVLAGPSVFGIITNTEILTNLGNVGILFLMFFIGMEMNVERILKRWKLAIIGTLLQILLSVFVVFVLGKFLGWSIGMIVLLGFMVSLSSTAVIIKIFENRNLMGTKMGGDVIAILLVQDLAVIPMIVVINVIGGSVTAGSLMLETIGIILITLFLFWILRKKQVSLPFRQIKGDHDLQLVTALLLCFGFALATDFFELSAGLGSFLAGLLVANSKETAWVHQRLNSFKILFVAFFFVSVGMLINLRFVFDSYLLVIGLVLLIFIVNTIVNMLIFNWFGQTWGCSFYAGATLSQIGEFSFLLAMIGFSSGVIPEFGYQLIIAVIALSLLLSPFWIAFASRFVKVFPKEQMVCLTLDVDNFDNKSNKKKIRTRLVHMKNKR